MVLHEQDFFSLPSRISIHIMGAPATGKKRILFLQNITKKKKKNHGVSQGFSYHFHHSFSFTSLPLSGNPVTGTDPSSFTWSVPFLNHGNGIGLGGWALFLYAKFISG